MGTYRGLGDITMKLTILIIVGLLSRANLFSCLNECRTYKESDGRFVKVSLLDITYQYFWPA